MEEAINAHGPPCSSGLMLEAVKPRSVRLFKPVGHRASGYC